MGIKPVTTRRRASGRKTPKKAQKRAVRAQGASGGIEAINDPAVIEQYRGKKKRHKYGAKKTALDGLTFDSKAEARRYVQLKIMARAGQITELELQPRFKLLDGFKDQWSGKRERAVTYTADFRYIEDGHYVVEDVKGKETQVFRVKWKLTKSLHPGTEFRIVKMV